MFLVLLFGLLIGQAGPACGERVTDEEKRHGLGFAAGTTTGVGFSYAYYFPHDSAVSIVASGVYLRDYQSLGFQTRVVLDEGRRLRLLSHVGVGFFAFQNLPTERSYALNIGFGLGIGWDTWKVLSHSVSLDQMFQLSDSRPDEITPRIGVNYAVHYRL